jgi:choline-sulfatase
VPLAAGIVAAILTAAVLAMRGVGWLGDLRAPFAARVPSRPHILLITLDTTRADHIGAYGYTLARTPQLDRLAAEGVLFERAVAAAPITLPAHASVLTARYPFSHGVRNNGTFSLSASMPTLATALHAAGYRTAAFVSAFVLDRRFGLARGFDRYDDHMETGAPATAELERRGDRSALAAGAWLAEHARERGPFFLWLHLYDPHDPYDPPPPFRDAFADRPYDGEIAFDDDVVRSLVDRLDRADVLASTIVAVIGDHGESLGDHGEVTHSMFVYESALRVPMILRWPGRLRAGTRVRALVRGIDLAPTLLDLAGLPSLDGAQGQSLVPLVRAGTAGPASAYGETYFPLFYMDWAPLKSIQDDRWKFIDAPMPELYDLAADPREQTNLAAREPARVAALGRALASLAGGTGAMTPRGIDRETAEKLAALGYVGGTPSAPVEPTSAGKADPKTMIGVFNRLRRANAAVHGGHPADGAAIARDVIATDPRNAFATIILANAEMAQGRYGEAIGHYRAYVALVPTSADAHHRMAICYARLGNSAAALGEEEAALAIDPRDAEAHDLRGGLLAGSGRQDEAIRELRTAVEIEPANAPFRVGLARLLIAARRLDEAETELRRAFELQPQSADLHGASAALLVARQRPDAAVVEFVRALQLAPEHDDVRLDFARTLDQLGRRAEAETEYQRLVDGRDTPPDIRKAARQYLRR